MCKSARYYCLLDLIVVAGSVGRLTSRVSTSFLTSHPQISFPFDSSDVPQAVAHFLERIFAPARFVSIQHGRQVAKGDFITVERCYQTTTNTGKDKRKQDVSNAAKRKVKKGTIKETIKGESEKRTKIHSLTCTPFSATL